MLGLLLVLLVLGQELLLLVLSKLHSLSQKLNRLLNRLDLLQALYLALDLKDMGQNLDIEHLALNIYY